MNTKAGSFSDKEPAKVTSTIMVTGGSGFVGQHLVRLLAERGKTVVAVYHHKLPDSQDRVYPVCSDLGSAELMAAPLRGVDTVFHLAWEGALAGPEGEVGFSAHKPDLSTSNLRHMKNLLTAMERAGTKRIVFLSALGAKADSFVPFLQEKYWGEFMVLNSKIPEKIILRSAVVWGGQGGDDRFLRSIVRVMRYPLYPVPKKQGGMAPVHVKDLAGMLAAICDYDTPEPAAVIDFQGSEHFEVSELFKLVSQTIVKKTRIPVRGFLGESLLPLLEREGSMPTAHTPKLGHFLAIGGKCNEQTLVQNPLTSLLPQKLTSFRERLAD